MEKINLHNYEAFLLDYAEGKLSADQQEELHLFVIEHPELKVELDDFDQIQLSPVLSDKLDWNILKKPASAGLKDNANLREELYLKVIEDIAAPAEIEALEELIRENDAFAEEFELWKNTKLNAEAVNFGDTAGLYRSALDQPLSAFNFDEYLIALSEGLLDSDAEEKLKNYVKGHPLLEKQLKIAANLRLTPAAGVFYPDKDKLYRKKDSSRAIYWRRAVSIAAVFVFGYFLFTLSENETTTPYQANDPGRQVVDTLKENTEPVENEVAETKPQDQTEVKQAVSTKRKKPENFQQEPAPVAVNAKPEQQPQQEEASPYQEQPGDNDSPNPAVQHKAIPIEVIPEEMPVAEMPVAPAEPATDKKEPQPRTYKNPEERFVTLGELAQAELRKRLIKDAASEDEDLASALIKQVGKAAKKAVDADIEVSSSETENTKTYSFRIGNFGIKRTTGN